MELKDYEYLKTDNGILYKGNAKDIIPLLTPNISMVLTDPPYELKWKDTIKLEGRKAMLDVNVEWDKVDIVYTILPDLINTMIDGANLVMFCRGENASDIIKKELELGIYHKAFMTWHKTNPSPQIRKKNFLSSIESIIWGVKGWHDKIEYTFNFSKQKEMHNFFEGPICMGNERSEHPTQKPLYLINRLLEIFSNPGDIVLDPFIGSGTLAIACEKMSRKWIGIEMNPEYCEIAKKRILEETQYKIF